MKVLFGALALLVVSAALATTGCNKGDDNTQPKLKDQGVKDIKPATPTGPSNPTPPGERGKGTRPGAASE